MNQQFINKILIKRDVIRIKLLFDKILSMKLQDKTNEQINEFLSIKFEKDYCHNEINEIIEIANQTIICKNIIKQFIEGKNIINSTEFHADENCIIILNQVSNINDYFGNIYACDLPIERNNLGIVILNNKINFIVIEFKSIIEDPNILNKFFEHEITFEMFQCQECGKSPVKNGMKCLHKYTTFTDKEICDECLDKYKEKK